MNRIIPIIVFCLIACKISSQIATDFGSPIKWDYTNDKYLMWGIDTTSQDSIIITHEKYLRKDSNNKVLEELTLDNSLNKIICDDEGPKLTGYWKSYFDSGELKRSEKFLVIGKSENGHTSTKMED